MPLHACKRGILVSWRRWEAGTSRRSTFSNSSVVGCKASKRVILLGSLEDLCTQAPLWRHLSRLLPPLLLLLLLLLLLFWRRLLWRCLLLQRLLASWAVLPMIRHNTRAPASLPAMLLAPCSAAISPIFQKHCHGRSSSDSGCKSPAERGQCWQVQTTWYKKKDLWTGVAPDALLEKPFCPFIATTMGNWRNEGAMVCRGTLLGGSKWCLIPDLKHLGLGRGISPIRLVIRTLPEVDMHHTLPQ